ncbi:MAG TPA: acyl-CoA dehydrogenase family protein [Blastocatellia bacterium]
MPALKNFQGTEGLNFFEQDRGFQMILESILPGQERDAIFSSLYECGRLAGGRWNEMAAAASRHEYLPKILKSDRVGNPLERIDFGEITPRLRREVAEFGVLTKSKSEVHKFATVYLLCHNGEGSLSCGLSCTDGLIRAIEARGNAFLRETYIPKLRSVETPFAGAQFVTERAVGSDVGAIEASASPDGSGAWSITGEKWFCSNPDEFFLVAARYDPNQAGTKGVAVFMVPRVLQDGTLNRLQFRKLKDKLGTQSLPTAEIIFDGATGYPIGEPADGFKTLMTYVINVSRVHNAASACAFVHRAFIEARNYARQREAFGDTLVNYPMIQETLITLLETAWRNRILTFRLCALLDEHGLEPGLEPAGPGQAMWQRFLINLAKYRTAVTVTEMVREAILIMGANGIVEDFSVLPRLLRDSMIIETWEGPHNTLSLQIVRDAARSDLLDRWRSEVNLALNRWPPDFMTFTRTRVSQALVEIEGLMLGERLRNHQWAEANARRLVDRLGTLLEIAWMGELAAGMSGIDWTPALLTASARYRLLASDRAFDHPILEEITRNAAALIDEIPLVADVSQL